MTIWDEKPRTRPLLCPRDCSQRLRISELNTHCWMWWEIIAKKTHQSSCMIFSPRMESRIISAHHTNNGKMAWLSHRLVQNQDSGVHAGSVRLKMGMWLTKSVLGQFLSKRHTVWRKMYWKFRLLGCMAYALEQGSTRTKGGGSYKPWIRNRLQHKRLQTSYWGNRENINLNSGEILWELVPVSQPQHGRSASQWHGRIWYSQPW